MSCKDRILLIQGLFETCGTYDKDGSYITL